MLDAVMDIWRSADWGTVPAGISAILTSSSLLIAAFAYRHSRQDARHKQANQVSAWVEGIDVPKGDTIRVVVVNASDLPIYQVTAAFPGEELKTEYYAVVPPHAQRETSHGYMNTILRRAFKRSNALDREIQPIVSFRDARGIHWLRAIDGTLAKRSKKTHAREWQHAFPAVVASADDDDDDELTAG